MLRLRTTLLVCGLLVSSCGGIRVLARSETGGQLALSGDHDDAMDDAVAEMERVCGPGRYRVLEERPAPAVSARGGRRARVGTHHHIPRIPHHTHHGHGAPAPEVWLTYECVQDADAGAHAERHTVARRVF